ncbi:hypothetical protein J437_LFUL017278 [Ladona fulva]|uniref:Cytochrome b-c1 complex subunit 10 n=1 Tax=Ladona fulva TaxID=123851 RepID=A0A8K0KKA6_LADFU|nr:hypothetical protein J437_LFUL017278 [Ladona fulva]
MIARGKRSLDARKTERRSNIATKVHFAIVYLLVHFTAIMSGVGSRLSLPGPFRALGKRHIDQAKQWIPSAAAFGAAGFSVLCYATDWKTVLQYMPYYNLGFKEEK